MSNKSSAQPGRRTPLSLSGAMTKSNPNKAGNNAVNGGGNSAVGHSTANPNKQDNKLQQQQKNEIQITNNPDAKETPSKRQPPQTDKKQLQNDNKKPNEKNQNGVYSNKQQQSNETKQQQQNKDKQQQQQKNGNDDTKVIEKDKKEKSEKFDKQPDKSEKVKDILKEDKKVDTEKPDNKKEEKKTKDLKDAKEDKKEIECKSDTKTKQQDQIASDDTKLKEENQAKQQENVKNLEEKTENIEIVEEQQLQQKSLATVLTPKSNSSKANKTSTPVNKTPAKVSEKTPQKSTPTKSARTPVLAKREITTTIDDDIEMEPLAVESSPIKSSQPQEKLANVNIAPSATSTPGKIMLLTRSSAVPKSDVQLAMETDISPERPRAFFQISGRKSIRPASDFTPSKFPINPQYRESYRRINTELDITNTSMNVTVGSEVPNNFSFSFFGRGRKRDRASPQNSHPVFGESQADVEISPPKKARLESHGFLSVLASPLTLLRNRFSRTSLKSSTPVNLKQKLNTTEDETEVQNVSGVSIHEEISKSDKEYAEKNPTIIDGNDDTLGKKTKENKLETDMAKTTPDEGDSDDNEFQDVSFNSEKTCGIEQTCQQSDIKTTETLLQTADGDPLAKNKRCIVM